MKYYKIIFIMLVVGILGCKHNHEEPKPEPEEPDVPSYERDTTGQYFIYDHSKIKELHAQPLHVIQESVQGKWKLQYSFWGSLKFPETVDRYMNITADSIIIEVTGKAKTTAGMLFSGTGSGSLKWGKYRFPGYSEDSLYTMAKVNNIMQVIHTTFYLPTQITSDSLIIMEYTSAEIHYFFTKQK